MLCRVGASPRADVTLEPPTMTVKHKHLILRAEVRNPPRRDAVEDTIAWVRDLVGRIDMNLLGGPWATYCDQPGNCGMTVVAIIETSHISLHVWDETSPGLLQMDVYSCADFDPQLIFDAVRTRFDATRMDYKFLDRENDLREIPIASPRH